MRLKTNFGSPAWAAFLSFLWPGLGQAAAGQRRRGAILATPALVITCIVLAVLMFNRDAIFNSAFSTDVLVALLAVNILILVYRLWGIFDAYFIARRSRGAPARFRWFAPAVLSFVVVATAGTHLYFAAVDVTAQDTLACVFNLEGWCVKGYEGGNLKPGETVPPVETGGPTYEAGGTVWTGPSASYDYSKPRWIATHDAVNVRSGAGTKYGSTGMINSGTVVGGNLVTGAAYTVGSETSTDWIKITEGPGKGGYAGRLFFDLTYSASLSPTGGGGGTVVFPIEQMPGSTGTSVDWADDGWLYLLLVGADQGAGRWSLRTDTIILLQVQISTGKAAMYGFPRNLYNVPLPPGPAEHYACHCFPYPNMLLGLWRDAVNKPSWYPYPGSDFVRGFKALEAAVGQMAGVHVDGSVVINLMGFVKLIDALGGLDINVPYSIRDRSYPNPDGSGNVSLYIPAGQQHMDGWHALAYARSRHQDSDYGRMLRQQAVLKAVRAQVDPVALVPQVPTLLSTLGGMLWTDMPQSHAGQLADLASGISASSVKSYAFTPSSGFPEYLDVATVAMMRRWVAHGLE
jgi:LCP family protein required for cell wall assembly